MRPALAVSAALVAALLLGGCGFDISQDDDVEPRPATVHAGLALLWMGPEPPSDILAEGECFADALMERLTLDELVEAGIVRDDGEVTDAVPMLDVDTAGAWVDAAGSCTPYAEVAARTLADRFEGSLDAGSYQVCLEGSVPADRLRVALVATLSGQHDTDPAVAELDAAVTACAQGAIRTG